MKAESRRERVWEIDFARGAAVFLMILFHAVFDLTVYYGARIDYLSGFWYYEGRLSAVLFMYVSGISSTFSKNAAKRGLIVFLCAIAVTVISIPVMGKYYIRFGILHFFGAVMMLKGILDYFVKNTKATNIIAAITIPVSFIVGNAAASVITDIPFLFPIGIITKEFTSYDYYPIFPWVMYFAAGVLTGGTIYKNKKSLVLFEKINPYKAKTPLRAFFILFCFLGKHSFVIYITHQPILLALLYVVAFF